MVRLQLITTGPSIRCDGSAARSGGGRGRLFRRPFRQSIIAPPRLGDCRHCDNRPVVVASCQWPPWRTPIDRLHTGGVRFARPASALASVPLTRADVARGVSRVSSAAKSAILERDKKLVEVNFARWPFLFRSLRLFTAIKHILHFVHFWIGPFNEDGCMMYYS